MTTVIGGVLSFTSQILGPAQKRSIELDTKSQILNAVMSIDKQTDVLGIYDQRIESLVVDYTGSPVEVDEKGNPLVPENVNISKNFKINPEKRFLPVFKYMNDENPEQVDAYILPLYGNGLWNRIYGFVALEDDLNTIKGISFGHIQETPGLGARIASAEIQNRYKEKKNYKYLTGKELSGSFMIRL
jgi:Na+-transporting NADH:ubiquinone oxidoreductase subunit C